MYRLHTSALFLIITAALLVLTGCGGQQTDAPAASAQLTDVTLQLAWTPNIEYSGFFEADKQGLYAAENLRVTIRSGGFDEAGNFISAIEEVTSGKADFGITDGTDLLAARAAGKPVVAIASVFQRHPNALVSLAEKNINRPQDLVGKTVMVPPKSRILLLALLASQGIDPQQVNIVDRTDFSINPLISGQADVTDAFLTNEVVQLKAAGHNIHMMLTSDYGVETYPNIIFTTEDTITNRADLVQRFVRATVKGIEAAIANPQEAAQLAVDRNPDELTLDAQFEGMQSALPLFTPAGSKPGMMTAETWEFTEAMLREQGILTADLDVTSAYTLTFLNTIYASGQTR